MNNDKPEANTDGQSSGLAVATGSAPSLRDILPPDEIIEAAEKVRVWMETNGYRHRWILGGVCSRDHAERLQWWIKNADAKADALWVSIRTIRGELGGEDMHDHVAEECLAAQATVYRQCASDLRRQIAPTNKRQPRSNIEDEGRA